MALSIPRTKGWVSRRVLLLGVAVAVVAGALYLALTGTTSILGTGGAGGANRGGGAGTAPKPSTGGAPAPGGAVAR